MSRRSVIVLIVCACGTLLQLGPVVPQLSAAVPGTGPGDNLTFVWNMWSARYALGHHAPLLHTSLLFYPFGIDLTLHSNTLLPSVLAAPIANPVRAQNLVLLFSVFLNFLAAYALARRISGDATAALLASILFGWSPFIGAHLAGHFNLIAAWVLPVAALASLAILDRPVWRNGVWLGAVLGVAAYLDYYFLVYACVLSVLLLASGAVSFEGVAPRRRRMTPDVLFAALLALDLVVLLWVAVTGGGTLAAAGVRLSVRGVGNPTAIAWVLVIVWLLVHTLRRIRARLNAAVLHSRLAPASVAAGVLLIAISPLIRDAVSLWRSGDYATQQYLWRSAPAGIDLSTFLLGNPFNLVYGHFSGGVYQRLGVNVIEGVGWLTPAMLVLAIVGARAANDASVRAMFMPAVVFLMWSLGPYVYMAGHGTTLWLPAVLLRWLPIVNNARIPARAIVVVYLAVAMLAARGFVHLRRSSRHVAFAWSMAALACLDLLPLPPPVYLVERPSLYETLRQLSPGAVCELPFGLRDGFGETGRLDPRSMFFQTVHEHPIVGGFVARMPSSLPGRYEATPVLGTLLDLSAGNPSTDPFPSPAATGRILTQMGIRYVVVNRRTSPPDLLRYVRSALPLEAITQDEERTLYLIRDAQR